MQRLLEAAERLVRAGGPEALTMDALAAEVGLSRATVYRQAGSREALLAQLAERGVEVGDRDDMRARVLRAAGEVFARGGFDAATIEAIAAEAGVGPATIYRHFGDKQGLIAAFVQAHAPRTALWGIVEAPSGDLGADLTRIAVMLLTHLSKQGAFVRLALVERMRGSDTLKELSKAPRRSLQALAALLRAHIERGELQDLGAEHMALAFMGMLISLGLLGPVLGAADRASTEDTAALVVRIFLQGLVPPAAPAKATPGARRSKKT